MILVLDTNILVSALWSPDGKASELVRSLMLRRHQAAVSSAILAEYSDVLTRPKFAARFPAHLVAYYLDHFQNESILFEPAPFLDAVFPDESDRKFYSLAKALQCPLITGNLNHYPNDRLVSSLTDFCNSDMF